LWAQTIVPTKAIILIHALLVHTVGIGRLRSFGFTGRRALGDNGDRTGANFEEARFGETSDYFVSGVLRHSVAMDLLQQGVDRSVIALWLGHESIETTEVYLHASMAMKEKALAKATSSKTRNGRYRPTDRLLFFLRSL
jgi:integrase